MILRTQDIVARRYAGLIRRMLKSPRTSKWLLLRAKMTLPYPSHAKGSLIPAVYPHYDQLVHT